MKTKILIALFALMCLFGCTTTKYLNDCASTNTVMSTSFNEEHYIWENWLFPSNKTTGR